MPFLGTRMLIQRLDRSRPIVDVQPILGRVAAKISRVTGASVVVLSHTINPLCVEWGRHDGSTPVRGNTYHGAGHAKNEPRNCAVRFGLIGHGPGTRMLSYDSGAYTAGTQRWPGAVR